MDGSNDPIQHQDGEYPVNESPIPQQASPTSPIDTVPEEMLSGIFKMVIWHAPLAVGWLGTVCRYWHQVVNMTPSLWSRILIRPNSPEDFVRISQYVDAAVANSSNVPLDITISFHHFWHSKGVMTPYEVELDQQRPEGSSLARLLECLVGSDGTTMARWRSLEIDAESGLAGYPVGELGFKRFIEKLYYPTPILESFSLRVNFLDVYFPRIGGPLQDMRSLKNLILDSGGHLGYIKFAPETIQSLCFRLWGTTKVLSQFTHLRNLGIMLWSNRNITYNDDPVLTFPLLECLSLELRHPPERDCAEILLHKIQAPSLTRLCLRDDLATRSVVSVNPYNHIRRLELLLPPWSTNISEIIRSYLPTCLSLTSLTVCPWHLDDVTKELRDLKSFGQLPVQLDAIHVVNSDEDGTVLNGGDMREILAPWKLAGDYGFRTQALSL